MHLVEGSLGEVEVARRLRVMRVLRLVLPLGGLAVRVSAIFVRWAMAIMVVLMATVLVTMVLVVMVLVLRRRRGLMIAGEASRHAPQTTTRRER
jgi:hypothetical protein